MVLRCNPTTRIPNSSACPPVRLSVTQKVSRFSIIGGGDPERLNSNSRVAFDHQIIIIIIKIVFGWEISDFWGNFGFSGKFWIFGEILDFRGNFGFLGKFWIFGEILDFRGNCTVAWVTRPERPKGVKDVIKQARRAQSRPEGPQPRSRGPEGPKTSSMIYICWREIFV